MIETDPETAEETETTYNTPPAPSLLSSFFPDGFQDKEKEEEEEKRSLSLNLNLVSDEHIRQLCRDKELSSTGDRERDIERLRECEKIEKEQQLQNHMGEVMCIKEATTRMLSVGSSTMGSDSGDRGQEEEEEMEEIDWMAPEVSAAEIRKECLARTPKIHIPRRVLAAEVKATFGAMLMDLDRLERERRQSIRRAGLDMSDTLREYLTYLDGIDGREAPASLGMGEVEDEGGDVESLVESRELGAIGGRSEEENETFVVKEPSEEGQETMDKEGQQEQGETTNDEVSKNVNPAEDITAAFIKYMRR
ncbi:hypothetical protein M430DRAFT_270116 [Amorphotheca resinae ATCC 22711]|uniref:Uncharacterized protein n=1 Tax=Amorphotheca resinae ATCC 22711 TaxID=857342 RepID=A0A2T3AUD2_AMORE|nr:hypothetical protein M430DRAFT_270116 [Amorphotheca resinae ATCC 22711]PSS12242.1 hypothetical protein M430DRAFT_270116 [Amorphotheca resinae ATCC 22711]